MKLRLCCLLFCFGVLVQSQTFQRAEMISGFAGVTNNNGVAVADYDADNDLDIFIVANAIEDDGNPTTISKLYRNNNNGTFTDVTQASGLVNLLTTDDITQGSLAQEGFKFGVSWGDYNNDGFPDIIFTHSNKIQLFRNMGNGTFLEATLPAGLPVVNSCLNTGATWFDYDNDGDLDIYFSDWNACNSNSLYRNNGNGTFTDVTDALGLTETESYYSYVAFPFDINSDGWMDLIVANDFDDPNYAYINQSGTSFIEDASSYGLDNMIDDMGIAISDFDQDQDFDFFITGIDQNALLENDGSNSFSETSNTYGLNSTGWSWGARFADFDLDGDEDLFVVNGFDFENRSDETNVYYRSLVAEGINSFQDVTIGYGLADSTISVETIDFDYDNDGDLDLFVTNSNGQSYFYENKSIEFDQSSPFKWFKVELRGTVSNRNAIGAILELNTTEGTLLRYKSGVGFFSQSQLPIHFGLKEAATITSLTIKWPSGLEETHNNLDFNTIIRATEGSGYEVLDIEPSQKIYGCTDPDSCNYNPDATLDDGTCTYLEAQSIDGATTASFLSEQTYTYPISVGSTTSWSVSGGHITQGQGTDTIVVKWDIEETGIVSVTESDDLCSSLEQSILVSLNADEFPEGVSVARLWNEALLSAIRNDFARPTVHARNLFHTSVAMYDAWSIYDDVARPYLIGNDVQGFTSELLDFTPINSLEESQREAISFAAYRLLSHRFQNSPGVESSQARFDLLMEKLGYNPAFNVSTNYQFGNAAALGNYIAEVIIAYGNQDGAREQTGYDNAYYEPVNEPYALDIDTNLPINDPNRWQPLSLDIFIDQGGQVIDADTPPFLSPEWGNVKGFALSEDDVTLYERDGNTYRVFHDPSSPPNVSTTENNMMSDQYKWGFSMVSIWQSHLDPSDGVVWDISPGAIGNTDISNFPTDFQDYPSFYNYLEGGDVGTGHALNPITNSPYEPNLVPRADYTRVLAEFWADGPDSETPPGHWFTLLNYVTDHPDFEKRFEGEGDILSDLEWDVKAYFIMGGAMHDCAISAWSVKGWYDYIRPISAIRYMGAEQGQSSDPDLPNYSISGLPLVPGYIELVEFGDPLAGDFGVNVGKVKLYTWRGHDFINNPETDQAGVGWILAEDWFPYQRPSFVTPPFAGYVSGHSTYSRAAAEIMTKITGDPFFPGGIGEFVAKQNEFLVFEEGPSQDVVLQWATYRDASDQTSLSRIWGGIHPPADDLPGRFIGEKVADDTFEFAVPYFDSSLTVINPGFNEIEIYPNPVINRIVNITNTLQEDSFELFDLRGRKMDILETRYDELNATTTLTFPNTVAAGFYILSVNDTSEMIIIKE
ncbi:FG-GAP-like repeat-containing protein [Ichthyenterobacterium sp. W332]|uniref:FG-GAP-like repeat-containing protein n=1 Tax=Microcosmobacter mediterraneus TaxID=3075607 RepID=A0ABU2YJU2_9FLAO|nr:FG-GAP-like repeat-containing protein [Ichthyenterobacterium sp. W332]MDT0558439.1 FG-GAP-like repeat-containing protein [Ichthyenterobacterium sp. W332]